MLFNSPQFLLFLPIVFALYWFVVQRNLRAQNVLLVLASYVFYGWWDWRFLGLIAFSTVVDYFVGLRIEAAAEKRAKKQWLGLPQKSQTCPVIKSHLFPTLVLLAAALPADAQRRRPPRNDGGQTPRTVEESVRSAEEKKAAREAELRTSWNDAQDHHFRNQDRATRKRMRQNDRRRRRMRQGRQVPWWRRIFGRPNRHR